VNVGLPKAVAAEMWLEKIARPAMGDKDPSHILDEDTLGLTEEPVALFRLTHHGASLGQTIEGLVVPRMPPTRPPRAQQAHPIPPLLRRAVRSRISSM
ncbi:uncharacterized protein METZ01_LOCUS375032, partial [marine metagenome]